jgi:hypothetical protein
MITWDKFLYCTSAMARNRKLGYRTRGAIAEHGELKAVGKWQIRKKR